MRIVILGFMGSGKTTVGKLLSVKLSMDFIDLDQFIENKEGESIASVFEKDGEMSFREKEKKILRLVLKRENVVISSGGGTPCFFDNMKWINNDAHSIYLKTNSRELYQRLSLHGIKEKRPLLKKYSSVELLAYIRKTLKERERFYMRANLVIKQGGKNVEELTDEIILKILSYIK